MSPLCSIAQLYKLSSRRQGNTWHTLPPRFLPLSDLTFLFSCLIYIAVKIKLWKLVRPIAKMEFCKVAIAKMVCGYCENGKSKTNTALLRKWLSENHAALLRKWKSEKPLVQNLVRLVAKMGFWDWMGIPPYPIIPSPRHQGSPVSRLLPSYGMMAGRWLAEPPEGF